MCSFLGYRILVRSMPEKLKEFLARWAINTLAVLVASRVVSAGIHFDRWFDCLIASLLLGMLTAFVRPLLMILSWPLLIVTLGLFTLVINAVLFYFVGWLMRPKFVVDSFRDAFWGRARNQWSVDDFGSAHRHQQNAPDHAPEGFHRSQTSAPWRGTGD